MKASFRFLIRQSSSCGSVLRETAGYIEMHSSREECPSCGSMLAVFEEANRPVEFIYSETTIEDTNRKVIAVLYCSEFQAIS